MSVQIPAPRPRVGDAAGSPAQDAAAALRGGLSLSVVAAAAAAFTATWTGLSFGGTPITDVLTVIACLAIPFELIVRRPRDKVPFWAWLPLLGAVLIYVVDVLTRSWAGDTDNLIRLALATAAVAFMCASAAPMKYGLRFVHLLLWSFVLGVAANAVAAVLSTNGLIDLSGVVKGVTGDRAYGLADHPNGLALAVVLAVPAAFYLFDAAFHGAALQRLVLLATLAVFVYALIYANSRAGLAVGFATILMCGGILLIRTRLGKFAAIPAVLIAGVAVWQWLLPALSGTRLAAGAGAQSDFERASFAAYAKQSFLGNPLFGAGLSHPRGVAVPLEVLSSGGLVFFIAYYGFFVAIAARALRRPLNVVSALACAALISLTVFGVLNNGFAERSSFWVSLLLSSAAAYRARYPRWKIPATP